MPVVAVGLALAVFGAGCGRDAEAGGGRFRTACAEAESATEDSIDLILAGKRDQTIRSARRSKSRRTASWPTISRARPPRRSSVSSRPSGRTAPDRPGGRALAAALAANRGFELIAGFGRYETEVPGTVLVLDYLDFEAQLPALGRRTRPVPGHRGPAVEDLGGGVEQPSLRRRRRGRPGRFDAHVAAMTSLAAAGTLIFDGMAKEAEHGLDLVDELKRFTKAGAVRGA